MENIYKDNRLYKAPAEVSDVNLTLAERMKCYEHSIAPQLAVKTPVILRIDGCHFHTFTRGLEKPFSSIFRDTMKQTMEELCKDISSCVFGYTQSDEITLVLIDYQNENSQGWYDYKVQKMCSVAASKATRYFNKSFKDNATKFLNDSLSESYITYKTADKIFREILKPKFDCADFDCRAFSLPKDEVINCLIWRQQDAIRNSISAVGQCYFSAKEMNNVSSELICEKLLEEKNINWHNFPTEYQRGSTTFKIETFITTPEGNEITRKKWFIDTNPPIFSKNKEYAEKHFIR